MKFKVSKIEYCIQLEICLQVHFKRIKIIYACNRVGIMLIIDVLFIGLWSKYAKVGKYVEQICTGG